jgi:hypothetical protein
MTADGDCSGQTTRSDWTAMSDPIARSDKNLLARLHREAADAVVNGPLRRLDEGLGDGVVYS